MPRIVRVASTVVLNAADEILAVRNRRPWGQDAWGLPGGTCEAGETLEEGARRETLEETGLEVEVGRILSVSERIGHEHHLFVVFAATVSGGTLAVRAEDDDVVEAVFLPLERAEALMPRYHRPLAALAGRAGVAYRGERRRVRRRP
jgi:8-oxo-dGTP diphosphatase